MVHDLLGQNTTTVPTWALWLPQAITALATVAAAVIAPLMIQRSTRLSERERRQDETKREQARTRYEAKAAVYPRFAEQVAAFVNYQQERQLTLIYEGSDRPTYADSTELDKSYFQAFMVATQQPIRDQLTKVLTLSHEIGSPTPENVEEVARRSDLIYNENQKFLALAQKDTQNELQIAETNSSP